MFGELLIFESGGNLNLISFDKYKILIEDIFVDEDEGDCICIIEMVEYIKIILIWVKESIKYKNKRGVLVIEEVDERMGWIKEKWSELNFINWGINSGGIYFIIKRIWRWWNCGL